MSKPLPQAALTPFKATITTTQRNPAMNNDSKSTPTHPKIHPAYQSLYGQQPEPAKKTTDAEEVSAGEMLDVIGSIKPHEQRLMIAMIKAVASKDAQQARYLAPFFPDSSQPTITQMIDDLGVEA